MYVWDPEPYRDQIAALCRQYHVRELAVFGSALGPNFGPQSDIDLLVSFEPDAKIGLFAFLDLQAELSALVERKVDLVPKNGLKPLIRNEVLAQAQDHILYAA
jgi:predicted nucleotidyltransferase